MKGAWIALLAFWWMGGRAAEAAPADFATLTGEEEIQKKDASQGPCPEWDTKPSLGLIVGAQLLERKDDSASHGPLVDEVTLGRTILAGLSFSFAVQKQHRLTAELVVGPYHNDVDRYCMSFSHGSTACPFPPVVPLPLRTRTRYAWHYGLQWTFALRREGSSPFIGLGIGAKKYAIEGADGEPREAGAAFTRHGAVGFESAGKTPFRVEARGVLVSNNPYLEDSTTTKAQVELQIRVSVRVPLSW